MLFVMRTWALVSSHNRALGGTTRQRLRISKKTSIAKVYLGSREREFELKVSAAVLRWDTIFRNRN